jgi:hypothetical protein
MSRDILSLTFAHADVDEAFQVMMPKMIEEDKNMQSIPQLMFW